jgi:hypothetical protein
VTYENDGMNWTRAVHHVEFAASECVRLAELLIVTGPVRVGQMWAFGAILGTPADLDTVEVALCLDLPVDDVAWLSRPPAAEHWLRMTRLAKNPITVLWRSAHAPVWNHRIASPLLVWDQEAGIVENALIALREGRGYAAGLSEPSPDQLATRLTDERAISLATLRAATTAYADRQWTPTKLGPTADALWRASEGYLDLLDVRGTANTAETADTAGA